jgi:hypothetical protein
MLFVVRAMVRLVLGSDELEQRIHLIGLAIGATVVSTLSLVGGFLAAAHIIKLDGSILMWIWPILVVVYAAGRDWASLRYGGDGEVMGHSGVAWYWLLLVAPLVAVFVELERDQMNDYQLGLLCFMCAALSAWGSILAVAHWRRGRRGDQKAS